MDTGTWLVLWGSPVGVAIFFVGLGVLLWGVSKLNHSKVAQAEIELKERQHSYERTHGKESEGPPTR